MKHAPGFRVLFGTFCLAIFVVGQFARGQALAAASKLPFEAVIWNCETEDLQHFDRAAEQAAALGATHMVVTADLPRAFWEYDTPGDPYPAWYVRRPGLLKVFPPDAVRPYVSASYADQVADLLAQRCAILRKHGLLGVYISNEPQVLPEALFRDHPLWRGPRVDQPNRSRVARFAPSVDEPEVLELYRQSMARLIHRCPEITLFEFLTTDSGSGLDWAPSLYPGQNGPSRYKNRSMTDRVSDFLTAMRKGASDAGGDIQIRLYQITPEEWMTPTFDDPRGLARALTAGLAIDNFSAPDAKPFIATAGVGEPFNNFFYPVRGIPRPIEMAASLRAAWDSGAPRLSVGVPADSQELTDRLFALFCAHPAGTTVTQWQLVESLAVEEVGQDNAQDLIGAWEGIANAAQAGAVLHWCYPFNLGGVHQRWITRPLVPYPRELKAGEKAYYRKFLLEAGPDAQADDLTDNQAMRLYKGWPGRMWITNVFNAVEPPLRAARGHLAKLIGHLPPPQRGAYEQLDNRLQIVLCLCTNARDAVNYQAVLDYINGRGMPPEQSPPLGAGSSWDRQMILRIARDEIDNSATLIELLKKDSGQPLYCAASADDEDITLLGPDVIGQLKTKIDIMNAHWEDYQRLLTTPNP